MSAPPPRADKDADRARGHYGTKLDNLRTKAGNIQHGMKPFLLLRGTKLLLFSLSLMG